LEEEGLFNSNLDLLGIDCKRVTDYVLQTVLSDFALQAYNSDRISFRNQECFVCSCGALSIPVEIVKYAKQKTFRLNDGVPCCKVCEKDAKITSVRILVYTTKFKTTFKSIKVYPCLYQKEIENLVTQIHEQGITISKVRSTRFNFGDNNLDIEFLWSFLPLVLFKKYVERPRLIITNQVLRQAVTAYLLCQELIQGFEADLVVSPLIAHPGKIEKWSLSRLRTLGYDGDLLRLVLLSSLGWNRKEASLNDSVASVEYRRLNLFQQAVLEAKPKSYGLREAMQNLSQQNLVNGLSNVFNPERFDYATLRGLF